MTKDTVKKDAAPKAEAKTRTVLTPAQRIAKLKAEAEALEKREADRARGQMVKLEERTKALVAKRDKINAEIEELGKQHVALSKLLPEEPITEDSTTDES
jgi:chromosome segregation ATPase